jgi:hypothetical protein
MMKVVDSLSSDSDVWRFDEGGEEEVSSYLVVRVLAF